MKSVPIFGATVIYFALASGLPARAGDALCVSCDGPAKAYLCTVKKADQIEMLAGAKAVRKICTKVIANTGPHARCHVTNASPTDCPGAPKLIDWKTVKAALQAEAEEARNKPAKPATATPHSPAAKNGPVPANPNGLAAETPAHDKAAPPAKKPNLADGITDAAEKTWDCVSNLFDDCL